MEKSNKILDDLKTSELPEVIKKIEQKQELELQVLKQNLKDTTTYENLKESIRLYLKKSETASKRKQKG